MKVSAEKVGSLACLCAVLLALFCAGCAKEDDGAGDATAASNVAPARPGGPTAGATPYPGMQGAKLVVPGDGAKK